MSDFLNGLSLGLAMIGVAGLIAFAIAWLMDI